MNSTLSLPQSMMLRTTFNVLGVKVDAVTMSAAIARIEHWIAQRDCTRYVTLTNVHAVMEARSHREFQAILNEAAMVCPDGRPLVWIGNKSGAQVEQVCGPELMRSFLGATARRGYSHYFYGGSPRVVERLASSVRQLYPRTRVAGYYSPPYRPLTPAERNSIIAAINEAQPDVLWVGLGCPKQERWMYENSPLLTVPVVLGVGQAFDIHAGVLAEAPQWMRCHGLEWLFRLLSEPKRLCRRYLVTNTGFVYALARSYCGMDLKR